METQPGAVNWSGINTSLNKGEGRSMAWHAVAHGADAVLYWQWRSAPGGQEQLHGSILGADGKPRPFYSEVQQLGHDFAAAGSAIAGAAAIRHIEAHGQTGVEHCRTGCNFVSVPAWAQCDFKTHG